MRKMHEERFKSKSKAHENILKMKFCSPQEWGNLEDDTLSVFKQCGVFSHKSKIPLARLLSAITSLYKNEFGKKEDDVVLRN